MSQRLGQHFLKNPRVLRAIARCVYDAGARRVIEIGGGHGELTRALLASPALHHLLVIEKDPRLFRFLQKGFLKDSRAKIILGDARTLLKKISEENGEPYAVVGNIPYYLTGHLFRILGTLSRKPEHCIFLVQKEVALRVAARPPRMNRLAATVQFWAEPRVLLNVPRESFAPPPAVDSALLHLQRRISAPTAISEELFYELVHVLFSQPRKTALNNLRRALQENKQDIEKLFQSHAIRLSSRPGEFSLPQLESLTRALGATLLAWQRKGKKALRWG